MEVRIKDNNGYVAADWTIEDGVMIVSPKVEKFEPKDGDVVSVCDGSQIFICKYYIGDDDLCAYIGWDFEYNRIFEEGDWSANRFATDEEKQKLFDKLKEKGYEWDAEKKELLKLKWKPRLGDKYWKFRCTNFTFRPDECTWENFTFEKEAYNKGFVFKTEEECQAACDLLNDAINSVKPWTKKPSKKVS